MATRIEFQQMLESVLGSKSVYFQPPENLILKYPCIVYQTSQFNTQFADNRPYIIDWRYQVTFITRNPDDPIVEKLSGLPSAIFDRYYASDSLHHFVYEIYR